MGRQRSAAPPGTKGVKSESRVHAYLFILYDEKE